MKPKQKLHYAWVVCICCSLAMFCVAGLTSTCFSVFSPYLISQAGLSGAQTSSLLTIRSLAAFLALFVVTQYSDKLGLRLGIALGTLVTGLGFLFYAIAGRSYLLYCVGAAVTGIGYTLGGITPIAVLFAEWFHTHRSLAMGICSAGTGVSSILVPQILIPIFEKDSLRTGFLLEAAFVTVVAVLLFVLLRNHPSEKGLSRLGAEEIGKPVQVRRLPLHRTLSRGDAAWMVAATFLMGIATIPGPSHISVLYKTEGFSAESISLLLSLFGAALIVGKCLLGQLADRFGSLRATVPFYLLVLSGYALCALAGMGSMPLAIASVLTMGVGCAVGTLCYSMFAGDMCPPEQFGATVRTYQLTSTLGGMASSFLPGLLADLTGHYMVSYVAFVAIGLVSLGMICLVYRHLEQQA